MARRNNQWLAKGKLRLSMFEPDKVQACRPTALFQRAKRTWEPPAGGRGNAPLELAGWWQPASSSTPRGSAQSTFALTPQRGGGVKVLLFRSCTNRGQRIAWREDFSPGKEERRRKPDGFQAFLTRSRRKMFRQDTCRNLLVQLVTFSPRKQQAVKYICLRILAMDISTVFSMKKHHLCYL